MEPRLISDNIMVEESARYIVTRLYDIAQKTKIKLVVALSGGESPKALYPVLAEIIPRELAERLYLIQVDERIIPPTDPDSNQYLIYNALDPLIKKGAEFFPIPVMENNAITLYHNALSSWFTEYIAIPALALLGVGDDGHTASIFPGMNDTVFPVIDNDLLLFKTSIEHNGYYRFSLSYKALFAMGTIIMYVPGKKKSAIVQAISDPKNIYTYPAAQVLQTHHNCTILASE